MSHHSSGRDSWSRTPATLSQLLSSSPMLSARMANISLLDWRRAVGDRIAQKALPERLVDETLTVRVPSSTWAQELSLLSHTVLSRLKEAGHRVERLRFHVVPREPQRSPPVLQATRAPLPPQLEASLERLNDPELRAIVGAAAAYSLGRTERVESEV